MVGGDVSLLLILGQIDERIREIRMRYGCDHSLWKTVIENASRGTKLDSLKLGAHESDGGPALRTAHSLGLVTCSRVTRLKKSIDRAEDEFTKKDLERRYQTALAECNLHSPPSNLTPNQLVIVSAWGNSEQNRFETKVLAVAVPMRLIGRDNSFGFQTKGWLLYPIAKGVLVDAQEILPKIAVHVEEDLAREVRKARGSAIGIQFLGKYQGYGPVPTPQL